MLDRLADLWSVWSTYRPSDFLMFSPATWSRLVERYNAEVWPAHLAAVAGGLALALVAWRGGPPRAARVASAALGGCWIWVAWGFHLQRHAEIQPGAVWFAGAFAVQGGLLVAAAALPGAFAAARRAGRSHRIGSGLGVLGAVLVLPWAGPALGGAWRQLEVAGLAPDATAAATVGWLLGASPPWLRRLLLPIPVLWCLIAALTRWTLHHAA